MPHLLDKTLHKAWGLAANFWDFTADAFGVLPPMLAPTRYFITLAGLKLKYSNAASSSSSFIECRTTLVATIAGALGHRNGHRNGTKSNKKSTQCVPDHEPQHEKQIMNLGQEERRKDKLGKGGEVKCPR